MFQGFTDRTIDFLWNVRFNNTREWMAQHKQEYQRDLLLPLRELGQEVHAAMAERWPDEHLCLHVARIYRDARRMHGRPPLKEELWFSVFGGGDRRTEGPEFYFSVAPEGYSFGLGIWCARAADMARFRRDILEQPDRMSALVERFNSQQTFALRGQDYVKSKGEVSELLRPWFQKRTIYFDCDRSYDEIVFSRQIVDELVENFSFLMPFYQYFDRLCGQEDG